MFYRRMERMRENMIDRDANPGLIGTKKPFLALKKALYKYYGLSGAIVSREKGIKIKIEIRKKKGRRIPEEEK